MASRNRVVLPQPFSPIQATGGPSNAGGSNVPKGWRQENREILIIPRHSNFQQWSFHSMAWRSSRLLLFMVAAARAEATGAAGFPATSLRLPGSESDESFDPLITRNSERIKPGRPGAHGNQTRRKGSNGTSSNDDESEGWCLRSFPADVARTGLLGPRGCLQQWPNGGDEAIDINHSTQQAAAPSSAAVTRSARGSAWQPAGRASPLVAASERVSSNGPG